MSAAQHQQTTPTTMTRRYTTTRPTALLHREGVDPYRALVCAPISSCNPGTGTGRSRSRVCLADHGEMILTDSSRGPSEAVLEAPLR